jgi:hypothetical protein
MGNETSGLDKTIAGSLISFVVTTITWMTYIYVEGLTNPLASYGGVLGNIMRIDFVVSLGSAAIGAVAIIVKWLRK